MANALIDLEEIGPCSVSSCKNTGKRARGARDIEEIAEKTGVFVKSFYCDDCIKAMAQRAIWGGGTSTRAAKMSLRLHGERPTMTRKDAAQDEM